MGSFSRDWLALREPADHAARNRDVLAAVAAAVADRDSLSIVDLGSGAGSNLRGCALALPPERQHWTLLDSDTLLLAVARERLVEWADQHSAEGDALMMAKEGKTIEVVFRQADLREGIASVVDAPIDMVTASALFDLASPEWIRDVVTLLAARRLPLYAVLTYDGREAWSPRHAADEVIHRAFISHQHRDKGFGPSAGPDATGTLVAAFASAGYVATLGDSSWKLTAADAELLRELARGIAAAARETGEVASSVEESWAEFREQVLPASGATTVVGHSDLFVRPAR